ncbi:MAG: hypothetical protein LBF68_03075 [Christensenellaceae bacterium]|jgi:hypothetical protein|nr:hypothetical protein [Christensenellaceae bacterium]
MIGKKKRMAIVVILLVFIVALSGCSLFSKKLKKDEEKSTIVGVRVENAQYRPELDRLSKTVKTMSLAPMNEESQLEGNPGYREISVSQIDETGFIEILNVLPQIISLGVGKNTRYDTFEIKDEIAFIVKNAPYFNQWFRLPTMREGQGYISIPYYEGWAFFIESDADARDVTITRVTYPTAFGYYDFDQESENDSHRQYQVMQTRYYFDDQNREIVECFVYNVAVVNRENIPIAFQYLKNVKDTSFTLYRMIIAESYNNVTLRSREGGRDIRGKYPYGTSREFIELNYANENEIQLLKIKQILATDVYDTPPTTDITFYNLTEKGVQFLAHTYDYAGDGEKLKLITMDRYSYLSVFNEFDAPHYFCTSPSLNGKNREIPLSIKHSEIPTRTLTWGQTLGDENSLLRSLQETIIKMAENLGLKRESSLQFANAFVKRTTIYDSSLSAEKALDDFILDITMNIVNNSHLKSEWDNIYRSTKKAIKTPDLYGPFIGTKVPLRDFSGTMDFLDSKEGFLNVSAYTWILDQQYADCQMRLALRSAYGEYTLMFLESTTIIEDDRMIYNGEEIRKLEVFLNKEGVYTAVFVLTRIIDGIETVVLDTLQIAQVEYFTYLSLPETITQDGDTMSYEVDASGRKLVITATKTDK